MKNQYELEKNLIKEALGEKLYNILKNNNVILAGGAITSLFTRKSINDYDLYFPNEESFMNVCKLISELYSKIIITSITKKSLLIDNLVPVRDVFNPDNRCPLNLIIMSWFKTPKDIFDDFDFSCCMGAFDFASEKFVFHPDFLYSLVNKEIKYNKKSRYPGSSLIRLDKYQKKGFSISKIELVKILLRITQLKINSINDFKENFLNSCYGESMDINLKKEENFSIDSLINELSNIESNHYRNNSKKNISVNKKMFILICETLSSKNSIPFCSIGDYAYITNIDMSIFDCSISKTNALFQSMLNNEIFKDITKEYYNKFFIDEEISVYKLIDKSMTSFYNPKYIYKYGMNYSNENEQFKSIAQLNKYNLPFASCTNSYSKDYEIHPLYGCAFIYNLLKESTYHKSFHDSNTICVELKVKANDILDIISPEHTDTKFVKGKLVRIIDKKEVLKIKEEEIKKYEYFQQNGEESELNN